MRNADAYYKQSMEHKGSSVLLAKFFQNKYDEKLDGKDAIDIGCGAGNDTMCLLKKGFKVTAIDSDLRVKGILEDRAEEYCENLDIVIGDFSKVELHSADLIFANFSLFFVRDNFTTFVKGILKNVNQNGFFVGNFIGKEDHWAKSKTKSTIEKEELLKIFKGFKIHYFSEEKYIKDTISKKDKRWHVYTVIAQKK